MQLLDYRLCCVAATQLRSSYSHSRTVVEKLYWQRSTLSEGKRYPNLVCAYHAWHLAIAKLSS